ncbi:MAG: LarC family nickel insertion protein, partial [Solirubrobacteraceae bacterium]|nr:LarC family nickel insertion protein [Solirubrobacteraceae bacterium]
MSRIAWLDPFSGISGDMMLGALVSAGWPAAEAEGLPARLGLAGVTVRVSEARRGPFAATRVEVEVAEERQPHRHLRHVREILERAELPATARGRALEAFERLASAEAAVHGSTPEKVHFHEVGAADALVDVAGAMCGLEALGVARVHSRPPLLGTGTVQSEHGLIPVPAPATVRLLEGLPVEIGDLPMEMTTPTGAAILATVVADWGPPPPMRLLASGVGAGGRDPKQRPNVLRLLLGETVESALGRRRVAVLETALDDENPQYAAALVPALLEAGALDAMLVP